MSYERDEPVRIAGFGERRTGRHSTPLVQIGVDDEGHVAASPDGAHRNYAATARLRYVEHESTDERLSITQLDPRTGLRVTTHIDRAPMPRFRNEITNTDETPHRLNYISSLCLTGFAEPADRQRLLVHYANNSWITEFRWQQSALEQAGIVDTGGAPSRSRFAVGSVGSWSTGNYLPMGAITDPETSQAWLWQVEHNGAWNWEIDDDGADVLVHASGPTESEHQCSVLLGPGEQFNTVPVSLVYSADGIGGALRAITEQRRRIRRPNDDNVELPIIFNDYMNCLMGDPTTEKLLPLIDAAADLGSEYFVIDAGWYAETDSWWSAVGEWQPSTRRFPGGLGEVIDRIRDRKMIAGLWLEPEVVGVDSPVAQALPPEAFFTRRGTRVAENGRYHLDLRHPAAVAHLDSTVDRLVNEFGVGYFKFDYNVNIGAGTDFDADSPGAGLLGHNRAYSAWLDGLFQRHPDLVIENCSSGGMRVDYAQLALLSLQSTSDQEDPLHYVPIAAAAPSAVTPEQAAMWAYPQPDYPESLNTLTLVNALLGRVHLSGRIDLLDDEQRELVRSALDVYRAIRRDIRSGLPHWPLGLPGWYEHWSALALQSPDRILVATWRRGGADSIGLPLPFAAGVARTARVLVGAANAYWDESTALLKVGLDELPAACLIELSAAR